MPRVTPRAIRTGVIVIALAGIVGPVRAVDIVHPEDYKSSSDPDDTLSINRALATKQPVRLRDGTTYNFCAPLILNANQELYGGVGTVLKACGNWAAAHPLAFASKYSVAGEMQEQFIHNANWAADSRIDTTMAVHDLTIDGSAIPIQQTGGLHAIAIRMATNYKVYHVNCINVGDCSTNQNADGFEIYGNRATGITNAAWDVWDGAQNGRIHDNYAECFGTITDATGKRINPGYALAVNGASSVYADRSVTHIHSYNNYYKCANGQAGVFVSPLSSKSSISDFTSENDTYDAGGTSTHMLVISGAVHGALVRNPKMINENGGNAIAVNPDTNPHSGTPDHVDIIDAKLENVQTYGGHWAPIAHFGLSGSIINPKVRAATTGLGAYSATAPYSTAIYIAHPATVPVVNGQLDRGEFGTINRAGAVGTDQATFPASAGGRQTEKKRAGAIFGRARP